MNTGISKSAICIWRYPTLVAALLLVGVISRLGLLWLDVPAVARLMLVISYTTLPFLALLILLIVQFPKTKGHWLYYSYLAAVFTYLSVFGAFFLYEEVVSDMKALGIPLSLSMKSLVRFIYPFLILTPLILTSAFFWWDTFRRKSSEAPD